MSAENEKNRYDKNSSDTNFPENIGQGQRTGETITGPLPNGHKIRKTRSNWMGNTIVGPLPGVTPAQRNDRTWYGRTITGPIPRTMSHRNEGSDR